MLSVILVAGGLILALFLLYWTSGVFRFVSNSQVGIVEKLWSRKGSIASGFIPLNGEAGYQPEIRRGGPQFFFPFQYRLHMVNLVNIQQGQIGYVYARDGKALSPTQSLASNTPDEDFQDVRAFLNSGGQKGAQRKILREGTHAINLAQFVVLTSEHTYALDLNEQEKKVFDEMRQELTHRQGFTALVISGAKDQIGIVTIHDGPTLPSGEIIAPDVGDDPNRNDSFHNNFQDIEKFLKAGGFRGRQLQVLCEGTYYLNRLFATVELVDKTIIEVGTVGVVNSYTGKAGIDSSGESYKHGVLVPMHCRGVWETPLLPGKYAFNPYAGKVIIVPTTNFILKWQKEEAGSHKFDENLKEVTLITKDAFEPTLPLSVVVHIDYKMAPLVVQRFGDIKKLVDQTLDPMVSAYFKNIAQTKTLIQLLQERSQIQKDSSQDMRNKFADYNLELQEVLIGTPSPGEGQNGASIELLLIQLRDRQVAVEKVETYRLQQEAASQERTLKEAQAKTNSQTVITQSLIDIEVQENQGKAAVARAQQDAEQVKITAQAHGEKLRLEGAGEADRIRQIGLAEAEAILKKSEAYGSAENQLISQVSMRWAEAIEKGQIQMVPTVQVNGGGGAGEAGGPLSGLLALALNERATAAKQLPAAPAA